jgi:hypothetical protein
MFVIVACAARADRAARTAFLHALGTDSPIEDVVLHDEAAVAPRLRELASGPRGTTIRLVLDANPDVLDALNLHREKLRTGARFVLWIAGQAAYQELVRRAPDAFSFRDAVAIVEGDEPPPPMASQSESDALRAARARCVRVGTVDLDARATAWAEFVEELFAYDAGVARSEASKLIGWASGLPESTAVRRALARALCYRNPNVDRRLLRQREDILRALSLLEGLTDPIDRALRVLLRTNLPAPPGYGRDWSLLEVARADAASPIERARTARACFLTLLARDSVRDAVAPPHTASLGDWQRAMVTRDAAHEWLARGRWKEARRASHEIAALTMPKTLGLRMVARAREANVALRLGELDACRRIAAELEGSGASDVPTRLSARRFDALARAAGGQVADAIDGLLDTLCSAEEHDLPCECLDTLAALSTIASDGHAAGLIDDASVKRLGAELPPRLERCAIMAGSGPPWFDILGSGILAVHVARQPSRVDEALAIARSSLATATEHAEILAPEAGRLVARLLLRQGAWQEADDLALRLEPIARAHHVAREVVELRATRLLATAAAGRRDLSQPLGALRDAFDESGAIPLMVTVCRDVGAELWRYGRGDVVRELVEPAEREAQEIPWPEEVGRCLEVLGRPEEAAAHYDTWGLVLRRMILARRIGGPRA